MLCPTSKMSHDRGRHTKRLSRDCAGRGRWLWRLVRRIWHHVDESREVAMAFAMRANSQQRNTAAAPGHFIATEASEPSRRASMPTTTTEMVAMITETPTTARARCRRASAGTLGLEVRILMGMIGILPNVKDEPRPRLAHQAAQPRLCRTWALALAPC